MGTGRTLLTQCFVLSMGLLVQDLSHAQALSPERQRALIRMVRQDCGSCHGMRLNGGLGPPLTPQVLHDKPVEFLAATIYLGRPGTPMPPWSAMISSTEADWIARQLQMGFPEEEARTPR